MDRSKQALILQDENSTGQSAPLGATLTNGGVNFSLFSRNATAVDLLLFDSATSGQPSRIVPLDSFTNRTDDYWHVFVPEGRPGQVYGYHVAGPFDPERGLRFDPSKVLIDPYSRGVIVP